MGVFTIVGRFASKIYIRFIINSDLLKLYAALKIIGTVA